MILSYYGVIGGWTLRYAFEAFVGFADDAGAHFGAVSEGHGSLAMQVVFMTLTIAIALAGLAPESSVAKVAMPGLFLIMLGIVVYAATLDGSGAGYAYYPNFDLEKALALDVIVAAAGQAFFSLSLGMGAILTFASYLPRDSNLARETVVISFADFGVAFVAGPGLPADFRARDGKRDLGGTIGALFVALPKAFASMGAIGRVVGGAFFVALVVGALTSAISPLEVVVSAAMDAFGWSGAARRSSAVSPSRSAACGPLTTSRSSTSPTASRPTSSWSAEASRSRSSSAGAWTIPSPRRAKGEPRSCRVRGSARFDVPVALAFVLNAARTWARSWRTGS